MSRYRLVAIDVDGTLTDRQDRVRPAVREAIRATLAQGVTVLIATGRAPSSTAATLADLGLDLPAVMGNGALLAESPSRPAFERRMLSPEVARAMVPAHRAEGYEPIVYDDPARGHKLYYERDHVLNTEYVSRYPQRMARVPDLGAWLDHEVMVTVAFCEDKAAAQRFAARLTEALAGRVYAQALWHPKYNDWMVEVSAAGCSKWAGILTFAERAGIAPREILAIGDGLNDLPMITEAGCGVAMGNADPEVREAADEVVADNDHDGVAEALERWVLVKDTEAA